MRTALSNNDRLQCASPDPVTLQARIEAYEAAKAERRAATAALRAVEGGIDFYAKAKNFDKLKEIAEASGVATKVRRLPTFESLTHGFRTVPDGLGCVLLVMRCSTSKLETFGGRGGGGITTLGDTRIFWRRAVRITGCLKIS